MAAMSKECLPDLCDRCRPGFLLNAMRKCLYCGIILVERRKTVVEDFELPQEKIKKLRTRDDLSVLDASSDGKINIQMMFWKDNRTHLGVYFQPIGMLKERITNIEITIKKGEQKTTYDLKWGYDKDAKAPANDWGHPMAIPDFDYNGDYIVNITATYIKHM